MADAAYYLERFKDFLRIPSISTDPAYQAEVARAAEWLLKELQEAGLQQVQLVAAEGRHPLVYAEHGQDPNKPTLLLYGHYDVQPAEPLELWTSGPFEPEVRGENIYARGACDDKGQVLILVYALREALAEGPLAYNVKLLLEGEEESGGEHLEAYVREAAARLACDAVLLCDTEMFAPGLPTICTGLRGIVTGEVTVQGARTDLHSGVYGGAAPNAVAAMVELLATCKDAQGVIQIAGLYDGIIPPSAVELAAWDSLPFDEAAYLEAEVGSRQLVGEPGYGVLHRTWARPTFEIHGIRGGYVGEGFKTVIPAVAVAKVSLRLVPGQEPSKVQEQLEAHLQRHCPAGVTVSFRAMGSSRASVVDPKHPLVAQAAKVLAECFGKATVYMRSGGSIPVVGLFQEALGVPSIMVGFGLPDDNLHAPNEKFHLPNFYGGIAAMRAYFRTPPTEAAGTN